MERVQMSFQHPQVCHLKKRLLGKCNLLLTLLNSDGIKIKLVIWSSDLWRHLRWTCQMALAWLRRHQRPILIRATETCVKSRFQCYLPSFFPTGWGMTFPCWKQHTFLLDQLFLQEPPLPPPPCGAHQSLTHKVKVVCYGWENLGRPKMTVDELLVHS